MFQHKQAGAGSAVQFPIDRPFDVQACSRYPYRQQAFDNSIRNDVTEVWLYIERVVKGFKSLSLYSTVEAGFLIFLLSRRSHRECDIAHSEHRATYHLLIWEIY